MRTIETDVFVIGAGPCGVTAALSLAAQGVRTIAISRYASTAHTPRSSHNNKRTTEVFRDLQVEEQVRAISQPLSWLRNSTTGASFAGLELVRFTS